MIAPYQPTAAFDAEQTYRVWLRLVHDEELYEATLAGRGEAVARAKGLDAVEIAILEDFRRQPGTRWHVENIRFRATTMVARVLQWNLPATIRLLTNEDPAWQRDLTYEYLAFHRWDDLGHHRRLAECERFAEFVRGRVMKRRQLPAFAEALLSFELGLLDLQRKASVMAETEWPAPDAVAAIRDGGMPMPFGKVSPRQPRIARWFELPADAAPWLNEPEAAAITDDVDPVHVLAWIPSREAKTRYRLHTSSARQLHEHCTGDTTVAEFGAESTELLRSWLVDGALEYKP